MERTTYLVLRHDFFRICSFIAINAFLCNFLPDSAKLARWPRIRFAYEVLVDLMAGFALNWRVRIPSLDQEFIGFRRTASHAYRNWQQSRMDRDTIR